MKGRRVYSNDDLVRPGDHRVLVWIGGEIISLWVILPDGFRTRIPIGKDAWSIEIHEDQTVTLSPSIKHKDGYHGFLQRGEWT